MKKIVAICLLCALCGGMASARNLVIKKDNLIVAMYGEDQYYEVVFDTDDMELTRDIEMLQRTYEYVHMAFEVRNEKGNWNKYNRFDEDYTFSGLDESGLLTLDFPAFRSGHLSIPEMKFEGMEVYRMAKPYPNMNYFEFAGETSGTMPESDEDFTAKMSGYIRPDGNVNFFKIKFELYVGNDEEPSYKIEYTDDVAGIPLGRNEK